MLRNYHIKYLYITVSTLCRKVKTLIEKKGSQGSLKAGQHHDTPDDLNERIDLESEMVSRLLDNISLSDYCLNVALNALSVYTVLCAVPAQPLLEFADVRSQARTAQSSINSSKID